jgi:hypothetical protein
MYSHLTNGLRQPPPRADGTRTTYRTIFHPGVTEMAEAASVTVGSGESRGGLDFHLRPVAATSVSGRLTSPQGLSAGGEVRLRIVGDPAPDGSEARTWLEAGSGRFTLLDVPAGTYYLEPTRYAQLPRCDVITLDPASRLTRVRLDVPPAGIADLRVPLIAGTTVTGSVVLKGMSQPPEHIDVRLFPLDASSRSESVSAEIAESRLNIEGVAPGAYELHASDNALVTSWWLESVTVEGRDLTGLPLVVGPAGVQDLTVVMTDRRSSIRGTVMAASQPVADATVVLFPVDRTAWPNARIRSLRYQTSRALRGIYHFDNVPAADYFIAAVDEMTMDAWPSPAFLQRTAVSAGRLRVERGSAQTIELNIIR